MIGSTGARLKRVCPRAVRRVQGFLPRDARNRCAAMFGQRRRTVQQRAKLMGRMVMLLTDGLCRKSYDQFVASYSNPGDEPDETERNARISRFKMRFSSSNWYEAMASLYENTQPWIFIAGGGDDCGVCISVARGGRCHRAFRSHSRFACAARRDKG